MTQEERLTYLISHLLQENEDYAQVSVPADPREKRRLLRSLMNVRPPASISENFLQIQDMYLQEETAAKGITKMSDLTPIQPGLYLWQGDITTLAADSIVNAANSQMLGCFVPCHGCIDNAIHTAAGIQLRLECAHIMARQQTEEPTGSAKITKAYNLPCRYILHTVGPVIYDRVSEEDCSLLADCYRSCLELAASYHLKHVAFCCISTGEFRFPNRLAAQIAISTVTKFQKETPAGPEVIFNVFKNSDYEIYKNFLR
ncbi:MAG: protein-ADP-ribose hydrolase [Ruminococcus sp.]|jgi:O-acetyl-ADP-ribose deacetylase (regulator of RNase III)